MRKQTRISKTKGIKGKDCPVCENKLTTNTLAIPGENKLYCSIKCLMIQKL